MYQHHHCIRFLSTSGTTGGLFLYAWSLLCINRQTDAHTLAHTHFTSSHEDERLPGMVGRMASVCCSGTFRWFYASSLKQTNQPESGSTNQHDPTHQPPASPLPTQLHAWPPFQQHANQMNQQNDSEGHGLHQSCGEVLKRAEDRKTRDAFHHRVSPPTTFVPDTSARINHSTKSEAFLL